MGPICGPVFNVIQALGPYVMAKGTNNCCQKLVIYVCIYLRIYTYIKVGVSLFMWLYTL